HVALGDPAGSAVGSSYRARARPRGHRAHGGGRLHSRAHRRARLSERRSRPHGRGRDVRAAVPSRPRRSIRGSHRLARRLLRRSVLPPPHPSSMLALTPPHPRAQGPDTIATSTVATPLRPIPPPAPAPPPTPPHT